MAHGKTPIPLMTRRSQLFKILFQQTGFSLGTIKQFTTLRDNLARYVYKELGCTVYEAQTKIEHILLTLPDAYSKYLHARIHNKNASRIEAHILMGSSAETIETTEKILNALLVEHLSKDGLWSMLDYNQAAFMEEPFISMALNTLQMRKNEYKDFLEELYIEVDHYPNRVRRRQNLLQKQVEEV